MLPLAVCIAGSLVKDRPLDPASWRNTHLELREKHVKFREIENGKLFSTIDTSFSNLGRAHRKQFQQLVVMASGFVATHAMLANLWQTVRDKVAVVCTILHSTHTSAKAVSSALSSCLGSSSHRTPQPSE